MSDHPSSSRRYPRVVALLGLVALASGCATHVGHLPDEPTGAAFEAELRKAMSSGVEGEPSQEWEGLTPGIAASVNPVTRGIEEPLVELPPEDRKPIEVKILQTRFDDRTVYLTVRYRNLEPSGVRARLYVFGYDINGQLVDVNERANNFQPREQLIQNYRFSRNENIARWLIAVR